MLSNMWKLISCFLFCIFPSSMRSQIEKKTPCELICGFILSMHGSAHGLSIKLCMFVSVIQIYR